MLIFQPRISSSFYTTASLAYLDHTQMEMRQYVPRYKKTDHLLKLFKTR